MGSQCRSGRIGWLAPVVEYTKRALVSFYALMAASPRLRRKLLEKPWFRRTLVRKLSGHRCGVHLALKESRCSCLRASQISIPAHTLSLSLSLSHAHTLLQNASPWRWPLVGFLEGPVASKKHRSSEEISSRSCSTTHDRWHDTM